MIFKRAPSPKLEEFIRSMNLESQHVEIRKMPTPLIKAGLYTIFGRRLFELYQKYDISKEDQRELEKLSYLLVSFNMSQTDAA